MEILDGTSQITDKYKFNLFSKLLLISLSILGIYNLSNVYFENKKVKDWIQSMTESGIGFCGTGLYHKVTYYSTNLFICCFIGGIVSLVIFKKNDWKISSITKENVILFSPLILWLASLFMWK